MSLEPPSTRFCMEKIPKGEEEEKKQGMLFPLLSTKGNAAQGSEINSNPVSRSVSSLQFCLERF